jgi:hypothetical protein
MRKKEVKAMRKNEEFVALLKSTVKENKLDTIPGDDLIEIYNQAKSTDASSNNLDIELSKAINTLLEEINKRGLIPEDKPQEIYTYKNSFLHQRDVGGIPKWVYTIAIVAGSFIFLLIMNALMGPGRILNMIIGAVVFAVGGGIYYSFKKRFQPKDTKPQEIPNYEDSSFREINKAGGSSKWVYAIAIPIIVISIALVVNKSFFSEAPKAPTFDLIGYRDKYKNFYGDIPLESVAKDAYAKGYNHGEPDYETWKKNTGIESIIQEDNDRRKPSFSSKLMGAIPFRYDEEYIQGRLYRYDRFNKTVEQRQGSDENSFKWVPRKQFKNLQHARDVLARNAIEDAIEEKNQDLQDSNEELKRTIDDMKGSVEDVKRKQEDSAFRERMGINH